MRADFVGSHHRRPSHAHAKFSARTPAAPRHINYCTPAPANCGHHPSPQRTPAARSPPKRAVAIARSQPAPTIDHRTMLPAPCVFRAHRARRRRILSSPCAPIATACRRPCIAARLQPAQNAGTYQRKTPARIILLEPPQPEDVRTNRAFMRGVPIVCRGRRHRRVADLYARVTRWVHAAVLPGKNLRPLPMLQGRVHLSASAAA